MYQYNPYLYPIPSAPPMDLDFSVENVVKPTANPTSQSVYQQLMNLTEIFKEKMAIKYEQITSAENGVIANAIALSGYIFSAS